jgi:hypothetical protein
VLWAQGSFYRTADGKWQPLNTTTEAGGLRFSLSPETIGGSSTLLIINKPAWMVLEDDQAPQVVRVLLDGKEQPADALNLGRVSRGPAELAVAIRDEKNPLDIERLSVRLNGKEVPAAQRQVAKLDAEGRYYRVAIKLGELTPGDYTLILRVPDRSPAANTLELALRFNSAPIFANGSFEQVDKDNKPVGWVCTAWDSRAETVYEMDVRAGGLKDSKALRIKGVAGNLNLVCYQEPPALLVDKPYVFSGQYKADKAAALSVITRKAGAQVQYLTHSLPAAADWTPFSYEFTLQEHDSVMLMLRKGGVGEVWFDDVKVELKP